MSQSSNTRIKDAGRKPYNALNVAFKPSKGEPKSTVGQNVRHGLQVLGKVGPRRTPAPTNLPSLRSENSGNDPCINLVPSGPGQGWGKKENAAAAGKKGEKPPAVAVPVQAKAVPPKAIDSQEISLRPNAGAGLGIKPPTLPPPTGTSENQDSAKMTWGNKVQQRQPASGSSQHFHREFPKLGGSDVKGGESMKGEGPHEENVPDANPQAMVPPPEFMGRMPVQMNMQPYSGERPIFSGAQMQYPYIYPLYPAPHGGRMMPHPYHYGYPGAGGKVQPIDPRMMERMAKGQMMGMPIPQTDRPSVVKDSDLRSLDDHKDDGDNGWAGTHEEVDYSAKLQFDESDDSEDEVKVQTSKRSDTQPRTHNEHGKDDKNQASQENWNEFAIHPYNQQMMMAFANHHPHWQRPPFQYDPQRGPPPGPHAFPFPGMYPHPMFFQQNMQPQSGDNAEDQRKGGERTESKEEVRVDKKEMERKAKLKKIEEGIKRREEESRQTVEIMKKVSGDDDVQEVQRLDRSRNNSEASDSSRRSNTVDIPPRFRRQISNHEPLVIGDGEIADSRSGSESPHLTIMKRKDSVKSEDSLLKEEVGKKTDVPPEKVNVDNVDEKYMYDKLSDQRTSRHGSSSSLYKETMKNERQKRYSSSSDSHDKDRHSFHGSSSSIHKENEKKEATEKSFSKKELKDLSETRLKDKKEKGKSDKSKKSALDDNDGGTKGADTLKINSARFADMKLNKGQAKVVSTVKEDVHFEQEKKDEPTKASPWSNVVSGKPPVNDKSDRANKSLRDIQQEEEEEENRKMKKGDVHKSSNIEGVPGDEVYENHNAQRNMRLPPDENRFRSDGYEDRGSRNQQQPYVGEDKFENRGYERRGRFNNNPRPFRKENEDGYRGQNYNRYKDNEGGRGGRGDQRFARDDSQGWNQRRGEYNNRRDDYNDRKDYNRNEYRGDRRDEARNDMHNDRRDEHKNDGKDDQKGDRRDDHKNDRQDDHKNKRRDEHKTDRRVDHKNERRDDEKGDKKEEHKGERKEHKTERREDNRGDRREDHRRTERKDDHKSERRDEHGHDWKDSDRNERNDRRQKDYKDDSKEDINKFERRELKDDNEKEDKGNDWRKVDKKDDYKRYDKRDNRRDINKKENYRKNEAREDKKDDKKSNYRDEHRKKDDQRIGRRDLGRPDRDGSRRYQQEPKEFTEDTRPYEGRRRKDEWSNRDYRLADDYQKEVKAMQESKEIKRAEEAIAKEPNKQAPQLDIKESKDTEVESTTADVENVLQEEAVEKTTKETTEEVTLVDVEKKSDEIIKIDSAVDVLPAETYSEKVSRIGVETKANVQNDLSEGLLQLDLNEKSEKDDKGAPDLIDLTKDIEEVQITDSTAESIVPKDIPVSTPILDVVDVQGESVSTEVKSIASDVNEEDGKPKVSGGFGVPQKGNKKFSRSEFPNSNYRSDNYRTDTSYRGGDSNYRGDGSYRGNYRGGRERGRGRGRSYTRGGSAVMSQTRRPSGGRYRGGSSRDESRRRKDDGVYEPISSDELSDSDNEDKKNKSNNNDLKSSRKKQPPRFQQRYDSQESRGRGRGRGIRSSERGRGHVRERGRGRGRGRGGSLHSVPTTHSTTSTSAENKGTDGESDAYFSADETITQEEKDDPNDEKRISSPNQIDREAKSRGRGLHRTRGSRGSTRTPRSSSKNGSFLVNRQQVGNKRNSNKSDKTLSAADKSDISNEVVASGKAEGHARNQLNLEDISTHSLPKKSKNQIEKREDRKHEIYKEFDLNNIASVVCIDNIKVGVEQVSNASLEEEGFVTVTSKKQQKEKRDREREELKKKMLLEQKQEPSTVNKAPKPARNATKGTNVNNIVKVKPTPFSDASITSPTTEQIHTTATVAVSSPLSQPSNVAMAAFGVWEPAQSLMRTSQQTNPCSSDMIKTSLTGTISTSINAWQRPLSLSATTDISMPDPRAVGTGKPSSSHNALMNKSNLVSIQATPETASTLVTPPALAPIGSTNLSSTNDLSTEIANAVIATDDRIADILPETSQTKEETIGNEFDTDIHQGDLKNEIKREKSARIKLTKTEKAPRFQTRKESEERGKNDEGRKARPPRPPSGEKTQKRSIDRPRKGDVKSGQSKKTMHSKEVEKQVDENSPIVFINEIPMLLENQLEKGTPKSTLSDADKVVGSNKPSLKSQSSLGSYSSSVDTNIEEPIMEVNIQESFQPALETEMPVVESEEQKVDGVRCTPISTLNNDDERSLETRSLPGTPPLAVKIPEPSPPGPSSDPGRGPSPPNLDKSIMPSVAQEMNKEMNEMNRRLLNARRAWEDTPTTWSDTAVVSSSASPDVVTVAPVDSSAPQAIIDDSNIPGSPSKTESSVTAPIEVRQKSSEEKVSVSGGVFSSKRTEQQVCKVKPQQQLPSEEIKPYQTTTRQARQLSTQRSNANQKYASYGIPMERTLQQNSSTLYTSESVYGSEQHRSQNNQALNFQSLTPGRSISTSVSPHSQQRDMVLSSLQVGNMYSANTLQVSQSQFLAWQVTPTVQPTKTVPYQTYTQGSSFTSPVSIAANSPVIMQYGTTSFAPQRSTSNMQRQHQHVNLMPLQQHQPAQGGRLVSMMPSRGGSHVRRNQQYQALQSTSDGRIVNPNQMALMLEPNAAPNMSHPQQMSRQQMSGQQISGQQISNQQMSGQQISGQQISGQQLQGQQRSDLMKHVHAKPFEPTSQTPPLMQSPPVVAPSSLPLQQLHQHQPQQQSPQQQPQQQLGPSVFNQPASIPHQEHVQNIHNYSQPIIQQRQHGVQHMQHQPPLVASVRPRSIQEQSLSNGSASLPMANQDRVNNISPFSSPFLASNVSYKGRSPRVNLQVAVPQQAINNQFTPHALQTRHGPSRSPTVALNLVSGPGPIQRPQVHQQPALPHDKSSYVIDGGVANDGAFKQTQRQKMLEDTKKYFEQDQKSIITETEKAAEEKPVSSVAPTLSKIDLSKHNKVVLPNTKESNGKKYEYKKNVRNGEKNRAAKRIQPTKGTGAAAKKSGD